MICGFRFLTRKDIELYPFSRLTSPSIVCTADNIHVGEEIRNVYVTGIPTSRLTGLYINI